MTRFGLVLAGLTVGETVGVAQPPAQLNAFAYADCGPSKASTPRVVLVQGPVPAAMPATLPRPSIEIIINAPAEKLPTGPQTIAPDGVKGGPNAAMVSCPVVGDCAPAQSGTLTVQRAADGSVTGDYRGQWSQGQPRVGKFSAGWRDSQKQCG
jgi:hypothetical protein